MTPPKTRTRDETAPREVPPESAAGALLPAAVSWRWDDARGEATVIAWNAAAERLYGYPAADILNRPLSRLLPPGRSGEPSSIIELLRRGERLEHFVSQHLGNDGRRVSVELEVSPLVDQDGRVTGASVLARPLAGSGEAIAEDTSRLRLSERGASLAVWDWNVVTGELMWDGVEALHGLPANGRRASLDGYLAGIHRLDRRRVREAMEQAARQGFDLDVDYRVVRPDGIGWVAARAQCIPDDSGRPVRMTGVCMDVTEQKQAEEAMARLSSIVESSTDAILTKDMEGTILSWNPGAERIYGYRAEEIVGRSVSILFPPEREHEFSDIMERLSRGERVEHYETERVRKDGGRLAVSVSIAPLRDRRGRIIGASSIGRDISERTAAEEAQRRSERLVREVLNTLPTFVGLATPDGVLLEVNQAVLRATDTTLERALGQRLDEIGGLSYSDDVRARIHDAIQKAARGETSRFDIEAQAADGEVLTVDFSLQPLFDTEGKVVYLVPSGVDITERRRMQEELRAQHARLRRLVDSNVIGVMVTTPAGPISEANDAFLRMIGYTREHLERGLVNWVALSPPEYAESDERAVRESGAQGRSDPYEKEFIRKDGSRVPVLVAGAPIADPAGEWICVVLDLSERKRLEDIQRFLAEASNVLSTSLDYETTLASVAHLAVPHVADWCSVDVVREDELQPLVVAHSDPAKVEWARELGRRFPADRDAPRGVHHVVRTGRSELVPEVSDELLAASASSEEHLETLRRVGISSVMCVPMVARGRTLGAITFVLAESGRHYGPADLAFAENLAHRAALAIDNARLFREVRETAEELRKANAAKDEFLGLVSHELRTPITTILGNAQVLRNRAAHLDDESRGLALADIEQEADRLHRIVDNMLVLARAERRPKVATEPVLLQRIVGKLAAEHRQRARWRRVEVEAAPDLPAVAAEPTYVEQVVRNLLGNAEKYSPPDQPIDIEVSTQDGEVVVRILDRGSGITPEETDAVFTAFYRSDRTARRASGTGIGLAVCKMLMEAQSGRIWARPREGGGSEFGFALHIDKEANSWL